MLDIIVAQSVKPGMEAAFEAVARQVQTETLANDKGCLRYEWYKADTPHTYILIERWESREAVQAHFKAAHFVAALKRFDDLTPEKFSVQRLTKL